MPDTENATFPPPDRTNLRSRLMRVYDLVFERRLTNFAGGNMTVRAGEDTVYITRSGGTRNQLGHMGPDDFILANFAGDILDGEGPLSVEFDCHTRLIREIEGVEAVIHTHSPFATMMAARMEPIPAVIDSALAYGTTPVVDDTYRYSTPPFVDEVVKTLQALPSIDARGGGSVLYPRHGALTVHRSLELAIDLAERVEWNALAVAFDRAMGSAIPTDLPDHADKPGDPGIGG